MTLFASKKLSNIHKYAFGVKKPKLEQLELWACNLHTLDENLVNWREIGDLSIGQNPFICDQKLKWLIEDKSLNYETHSNLAPR